MLHRMLRKLWHLVNCFLFNQVSLMYQPASFFLYIRNYIMHDIVSQEPLVDLAGGFHSFLVEVIIVCPWRKILLVNHILNQSIMRSHSLWFIWERYGCWHLLAGSISIYIYIYISCILIYFGFCSPLPS